MKVLFNVFLIYITCSHSYGELGLALPVVEREDEQRLLARNANVTKMARRWMIEAGKRERVPESWQAAPFLSFFSLANASD